MVNVAETIDRGRLDAEIAVVISSRSTVAGVERARELGLEPKIVRKKDFDDVESFSARLVGILSEAKVDLVCQCGWLCLWKVPASLTNRVMNIHPGLLPKFGGQGMWGHHVHQAVLDAKEARSGCTVHFVNNEYDAGPIILQRTCPVLDDDTTESLADRVFEQECLAFPEAITLFGQNRLSVQDNRVVITPPVIAH